MQRQVFFLHISEHTKPSLNPYLDHSLPSCFDFSFSKCFHPTQASTNVFVRKESRPSVAGRKFGFLVLLEERSKGLTAFVAVEVVADVALSDTSGRAVTFAVLVRAGRVSWHLLGRIRCFDGRSGIHRCFLQSLGAETRLIIYYKIIIVKL